MVKSKNTSELVVINYYCRLLAPTIIAQPVDYQYLRLAMTDIVLSYRWRFKLQNNSGNSHIIVGLWLESIVITILHLKNYMFFHVRLDENKFYIKIELKKSKIL